jgi:hypothetical protein
MTVCPATNTLQMLDEDDDDLLYYKYEPAEWTYEMEGANDDFNEICTRLRSSLIRIVRTMNGLKTFGPDYILPALKYWKNLNENFFRQITGRIFS